MFKRDVTLLETSGGWLWAERGVLYSTLTTAKNAVKKEDRARVKTYGGGCITILTIKPTTKVGTHVGKM